MHLLGAQGQALSPVMARRPNGLHKMDANPLKFLRCIGRPK